MSRKWVAMLALVGAIAVGVVWRPWAAPVSPPNKADEEHEASNQREGRHASSTESSPVGGVTVSGADESLPRNLVEPPPPSLSAADLEGPARDSLDYMNRMLSRGGKQEIPAQWRILESDLPQLVQAIDASRQDVYGRELAWRKAVNLRTQKAMDRIKESLSKGMRPPFPVLMAGQKQPQAESEFDLVSLYVPPGGSDRYVIRHFEQEFGEQIIPLKTSLDAQLDLFDSVLRQLFYPLTNPSSRRKE